MSFIAVSGAGPAYFGIVLFLKENMQTDAEADRTLRFLPERTFDMSSVYGLISEVGGT